MWLSKSLWGVLAVLGELLPFNYDKLRSNFCCFYVFYRLKLLWGDSSSMLVTSLVIVASRYWGWLFFAERFSFIARVPFFICRAFRAKNSESYCLLTLSCHDCFLSFFSWNKFVVSVACLL
jgi:hypothetical protein